MDRVRPRDSASAGRREGSRYDVRRVIPLIVRNLKVIDSLDVRTDGEYIQNRQSNRNFGRTGKNTLTDNVSIGPSIIGHRGFRVGGRQRSPSVCYGSGAI